MKGSLDVMIRILTFRETILTGGERLRRVAQIVAHQARDTDAFPLVVVSALTGVTEQLLALTRAAREGKPQECARLLDQIRHQHRDAADVAIHDAERYHRFLPVLEQALLDLEHEVMQVQLLPYGSTDIALHTARVVAWGERLAVLLLASAIQDQEVQATAVREEVLVTAFPWQLREPPALDELVAASVLMTETRSRARRLLLPRLASQVVPVVAGSLGRTNNGIVTTLGQGELDYAAALLAEALHCSAVELYTEQGGWLSADPRLVADAFALPALSYDEAWQLASFGSFPLHPRDLLPLAVRNIPLHLRSLEGPERPGTLISATPSSSFTTALALHRQVVLIHVKGRARGDLSKSLAMLLRLVAQTGITPLMLHLSSSHTCSLLIEAQATEAAMRALRNALEPWEVRCQTDLAACLCLGSSVVRNPLSLAYAVVALADERIPVCSQGFSDLGMVLVVQAEDGERAIRRLHRDFVLPVVPSSAHPSEVPLL
jgi:aspartate kinase